MIIRPKGLAPLERSSLSLSLSLFSRACIRASIHVPLLIFLLLAWAMFPKYGNVWFTFLVPFWAIPLECWQCLVYFFALCDSIVHDAYIYIYLPVCVYGWLCTLYDGLSWLHERPFLVIRALDFKLWVCVQDDCHRCIFILYCVHEHRSVIISIHVTKWHWFPRVYDTYQHV